MGYWWPPSIKAYDPAARPLSGLTAATSAVQVQQFTPPEVLAALGVSTLMNQQAQDWLDKGGRLWIPDILDVPLLQAMLPSPLVQNRGLLLAYSLLYETRPPSDSSGVEVTNERLQGPTSSEVQFPRYYYGHLPGGGLPPDVMQPPAWDGGPAGAIILSYWDLSDSNWPKAKCVTHWAKSALVGSGDGDQAAHRADPMAGRPYKNSTGTASKVMEWNSDQNKWQQEGADFEREFVSSEVEIFSTVLTLLKMVVGCVPVFGSAYVAMVQLMQDAWAVEMQHMSPQAGPISYDEVLGKLGADAIGVVGAIGGSQIGLKPDPQDPSKMVPLTFGEVVSDAAKGQFNFAMAQFQGFPVVGPGIGAVVNITEDAVSQGIKYTKALTDIGKLYGVKNITVDVNDIKKFVAAQFAGQMPAPVQVQVGIVSGAALAAGDLSADSPAEMPTNTYQRITWEAACFAYAGYTTPTDQLRLRRNAILGYRNLAGGNSSTIVTPGDESGIGAHGVEEMTESTFDIGTAFDQYLSQMYANEWSGSIAARAQYVSQATEKPAVDPFHGQDPRAPLNALVVTLKKRYGLV
jgi:hypothetical protein